MRSQTNGSILARIDPFLLRVEHAGIDFETAMGRIHAVLPDGTIVQNVKVFRRTYEILGIGRVYAITSIPAIEYLANLLYGIWADLRLILTGRPKFSIDRR